MKANGLPSLRLIVGVLFAPHHIMWYVVTWGVLNKTLWSFRQVEKVVRNFTGPLLLYHKCQVKLPAQNHRTESHLEAVSCLGTLNQMCASASRRGHDLMYINKECLVLFGAAIAG
jgi:hypothetical protein